MQVGLGGRGVHTISVKQQQGGSSADRQALLSDEPDQQPTTSHSCLLHCVCCALLRAQIDWLLLQQGSWEGTPYKLLEGSFK